MLIVLAVLALLQIDGDRGLACNAQLETYKQRSLRSQVRKARQSCNHRSRATTCNPGRSNPSAEPPARPPAFPTSSHSILPPRLSALSQKRYSGASSLIVLSHSYSLKPPPRHTAASWSTQASDSSTLPSQSRGSSATLSSLPTLSAQRQMSCTSSMYVTLLCHKTDMVGAAPQVPGLPNLPNNPS